MEFPKKHILVCVNEREPGAAKPSCGHRGGHEVYTALREKLVEKGLHRQYRVTSTGCLGKCRFGPTMVIYPQDIWYGGVSAEDVDEIIETSVLQDSVVDRLLIEKQTEPVKNE